MDRVDLENFGIRLNKAGICQVMFVMRFVDVLWSDGTFAERHQTHWQTGRYSKKSATSIQTSLERLSGRLTTVIIAHQQSAIVNAQQVVVLDRGRVVQRGEIGELTRKEGDFRNLMRVDCPATISG